MTNGAADAIVAMGSGIFVLLAVIMVAIVMHVAHHWDDH